MLSTLTVTLSFAVTTQWTNCETCHWAQLFSHYHFKAYHREKIVRGLKTVLQTTCSDAGSEDLVFESGSHEQGTKLASPHTGQGSRGQRNGFAIESCSVAELGLMHAAGLRHITSLLHIRFLICQWWWLEGASMWQGSKQEVPKHIVVAVIITEAKL